MKGVDMVYENWPLPADVLATTVVSGGVSGNVMVWDQAEMERIRAERKARFIKSAVQSGFTKRQATFLFETLNPPVMSLSPILK